MLGRWSEPRGLLRGAIVLALVSFVTSCGDASHSVAPITGTGEFELVSIDGASLPHSASLTAKSCTVTRGTLEVTANAHWNWNWNCAEEADATYAAGDFLEQPVADSIVFPTHGPTAPAYWGAGHVAGNTLVLSTVLPHSTDPSQLAVLTIFGEHRWTFRRH